MHLLLVEQIAQRADEFDVIHFHIAPLHFSMARRLATPHVTTLHGRLDLPEVPALYGEFADLPLVSVSDAQREPLPDQNWVGTVYHGLPNRELQFNPNPGTYLAFLGRISPEKRVDRAIAIAKACGWPLKIAAKVDPADAVYFKETIEPLLDHPLIEYCGEISEAQKSAFLGGAMALAVPDRLARAVRPGHDRGARRAARPSSRFAAARCPRSSTTASPDSSVTISIRPSRPRGAFARSTGGRAGGRSKSRFTAARMAEEYIQLYRRVAASAALFAD